MQQLKALNAGWPPLMNTDLVAGRIITQMIIAGNPATAEQAQSLKQVLRSSTIIYKTSSTCGIVFGFP
jgi:hypothetical protein